MNDFLNILLMIYPLMFGSPNEPIAGSCFLRVNHEVVLVRDVWSKNWSFPGGLMIPGESLQETAIRETLEETGLVVKIYGLLDHIGKMMLYACSAADDTVFVLGSPVGNRMQVVPIPAQAKNEIIEATLVDPTLNEDLSLRFFKEEYFLNDEILWHRAPNHELSFVQTNPYISAKQYQNVNVDFIRTLQKSFQNRFMTLLMWFIDVIANPLSYIVAFLLLIPFLPLQSNITLSFGLAINSLVNSGLKFVFNTYRPFEYFPELFIKFSAGHSFPSGHAQAAACFVALLYLVTRKINVLTIGLIFTALVGLSRVYLGVHFGIDVIGGIIIGMLIASAVYYSAQRWRASLKRLFTFIVLLSPLTIIFICAHPEFLMAVGTMSGILLTGILLEDASPVILKLKFLHSLPFYFQSLFFIALLTVNLLVFIMLIGNDGSAFSAMVWYFGGFYIYGLIIGVAMRVIKKDCSPLQSFL